MDKKFSIVVIDRNESPVPKHTVTLHSDQTPKTNLGTEVTDKDGLANFVVFIDPKLNSLTAEVVGAGQLVVGTDTIKIKQIPDHWVIKLTIDISAPAPSPNPAPVPAPGEGEGDHEIPQRGGQKDWLKRRLLRAKRARKDLASVTGKEMRRRLDLRRRGKDIAAKFVGTRPQNGGAEGSIFVSEADKAQLPQKIKANREAGLERLNIWADRKRGIMLDEATVELWGMKEGSDVRLKPFDVFNGLPLFPRPGRGRFERALDECKSEILANDELDNSPTEEEKKSTIKVGATPSSDSARDRIKDVLDATLGPDFGRPTTADVAQALDVKLPLGPADVDAYYDYHNLSIAWFDTWTAVSDGRMRRRIRELFETIVDVVDFNPEEVEADFSEIEELHDLLDDLGDMVDAAAAAQEPVVGSATPEIASWMPELAEVWDYISDTDRNYAQLQFEMEEYIKSRIGDLPGIVVEASDVTQEIIDAALGGLPFFLKILFGKKLWKIEPFDAEEIRDWVPDQKVMNVVLSYVANRRYFRNRVSGQVDIEAAARSKEEDTNISADYATHAAARLGRAERLIGELKASLSEPYQFDVFAKGAYNFGALTTYRQRWRPLNYQAGDLAGTLPLAPNERRSYSVTRTRKMTQTSERETTNFREGTRETNSKDRAEATITENVKRSMSLAVNSSATVKLTDYLSFTGGTTLNTQASSDSQRVKQNVRDFTDKAIQNYRDENKLQVSTKESFELSSTENREISNPNNEITVTYLFYELQRRYEVSERFHDIEPVILVAYDMPRPDEITEAWLLKYDWIIRRSILDQSYRPALAYLSQTFAGDEVSVEVLKQQWKTQLSVVSELKRQVGAHERLRGVAREAVLQSVKTAASVSAVGDAFGDGLGLHLSDKLLSGAEDVADTKAENARAALNWADQDLDRMEEILRGAVTSLERATDAYVKSIEKRLNRRVQIDRLILHVKENILHYMQEIWTSEHVDQRYLRLYDMNIQWPGDATMRLSGPWNAVARPGEFSSLMKGPLKQRFRAQLKPPSFAERVKLHEVADIDRLMGFRGNLAIFPLTRPNALSIYLAQDFLDSEFGMADPDDTDEIPTASEAIEIAKCIYGKIGNDDAASTWLMEALRAAHKVSREVIVPTGELFIEALPGSHPLLEDFKLRHRAFDMAKAAADAQTAQLNLIRQAMRLEDDDTSDPDVDKLIRIEGNTSSSIDPAAD